MNLDLNDQQTEALIRELGSIIQNDRYPLSPRIVALREILTQLRRSPSANPYPRDGITRRRARAGIADTDEALPRPANGAS